MSQYDQPKSDGKIHFSKHSWHYRLVDYSKGKKYTSLCPYMRAVVMSMVMAPVKFGWGLLPDKLNDHEDIGRIVIGYFLIVAGFSVALSIWYPDTPYLLFFGLGILGGMGLMALVAGIALTCFRIGDWNDNRPRHYTEHKTRGLMKEYVEAKHNKVCPSICFQEPVHWDKNGQQDNDSNCK